MSARGARQGAATIRTFTGAVGAAAVPSPSIRVTALH